MRYRPWRVRRIVGQSLFWAFVGFSGFFILAAATAAARATPPDPPPVLFGDQTIEPQVDSNAAGQAEAFQTTATASGALGSITVYLDASSTATQIFVGLYVDSNGHPSTLLTQGSSSQLTAGAWNTITVPSVRVTAGAPYWIALLGTGSGVVRFRDRHDGGCRSETHAQGGLTMLPAGWTTGSMYGDCPLSAYGSGITATQPILSVSPASLSFQAVEGGPDPAPDTLEVTNTGVGELNFTVETDADWLSVSPRSGMAPQTLRVSVAVADLPADTYTGHVTVTAPGAKGSPAVVTVGLTVSPARPVLSVSPPSLSFRAIEGGPNPAPAALSVTNTGIGKINFTAETDANWLSVSPRSGMAPQTLQVSVAVADLSAGTYTGHVTVTAPGAQGSPAVVTVTLAVLSPPPPQSGDWLMIEHDPGRSGYAADETAISPESVANLRLRWSVTVDGKVTAQPLFVSEVPIGDQMRDVVVAATAGNSIYALDAGSGSTLWQRNFGRPANNCAIPGGFGISAPPVIDRDGQRIYTVSDDGVFRTLSLIDGRDAAPPLPLIDRPDRNKVWGGLNQVGTAIYVATASDGCDTQPWRGRVYRVDVSDAMPSVAGVFDVVPGIAPPAGGGGIWGYGGVSVDSVTQQVYAASASDSTGGYRPYANRLIALDADLNLLGSFEPEHPSQYHCESLPCDVDFGATPIVFQPGGCPTLLAAGNKNGNLYLMRAADLAANREPLQILTLNRADDSLGSGGVGGVPAYWPDGNMLFITDAGPGFEDIAGGAVGLMVREDCTLGVAWSVPLGGNDRPNSTPTVANGVVFVGTGNGGRVYAYDAATGARLWDSGDQIRVATYAAPMVARGALYVGSWNGYGAADGGKISAFAPDTPPAMNTDKAQ